jgi:Ca-activated chloride channel family protein
MKKTLRRRLKKGGWAIALGSVALAVGAIVLLKAPGYAAERDRGNGFTNGNGTGIVVTENTPTRSTLNGPSLTGHVALSQGAVLANGTRRVLAELRLNATDDGQAEATRQPVALSVVLDVSGSMSGEKIEQAKSAVRQLVERMRDEDYVSLVTYDHNTYVLQPLAPVGAVRAELYGRIAAIQPGGGTVIPQALDAGARALDAAPSHLVKRLVLLSDGLDGSGVPIETVTAQIRSRATVGTSTSSLGIGADYDERFMTQVADAGRGNYEFLADGAQLQAFLHRELDQASKTTVTGVVATTTLPPGARLRRVNGAEHTQIGTTVRIAFGPLSAGESRRAVLDFEVFAGAPYVELGSLATHVEYQTVRDAETHAIDANALALRSVATDDEVKGSLDQEIYGETWAVIIDQEQQQAVEAWRQGDVARARSLSQANAQAARAVAAEAPAAAPALGELAEGFEAEEATFGSVSAGSADGRAYGLRSNATRRARISH